MHRKHEVKEESFGIIPLIQENGEWKVLLILHQGGSHWSFPKGHPNPGETPQDSAKREMKEETGLTVVEFLQETPLVEKYTFHRKKEIVVKTVHYFPALVTGEVHLQQEEIREAKWVPLKQAATHLTFPETKSMCRELLRLLNV